MIRVFNQYGNRKNKNMARMKFVLRERGFDWLREQIEKEYADILANGGIAWPDMVPEGFGGYQSHPQPLGNGALLPVVGPRHSHDAAYDAWLETNVRQQKQTGYAAVTVRVDQGNLTGEQLRGAGAPRRHGRRRTAARHDRTEPAAGVHPAGPPAARARRARSSSVWAKPARTRSTT